MRQWEAFATLGSRLVEGASLERADELSMPDGPSVGRRTSPMGGPTDAMSMPGQCPGDCVHDEEGPALAEGGDAEVAGRVEADWWVNRAALGQLVCWCPNWRQQKQPPFAWRCGELVGGSDGGGVFGGDVVEKASAGGAGWGLVVGVEESIVVKHAREEASKGHVEFVSEGGCKVFVAYSFDAGDEHKVGNDGVGEVVAEGAGVLDEAVEENVLVGEAEEGHDFARSEGTGDFPVSVNDLSEGIEAEVIGGGVVAGGVLDAPYEEGGGENGTVVEVEGLVDVVVEVVEVVGVEEVGGGVLLEAAVEEGVVCAVEEGVVCAMVTIVMEGMVPSIVVTRSHMDDTLPFMSLREAVTEVQRVLSAWRMAKRSGMVAFAGGCSPARLWAMLSTESVRMSYMLMEDAAMSGEEGVEDVA
ncbi:hypothetical protein CBR_g22170 [Chara braunii]|uniref:Uncharacterized protein n=1 Tax=Chara braunii TaxID=69332 RepID=A0A388L2F9_CHABU|nr:hypothetical protein CBR_g22170 [Chara braunii]|eukprot:GBG76422.1 hypothetical protein CBR_g22170 [Chara braunii]